MKKTGFKLIIVGCMTVSLLTACGGTKEKAADKGAASAKTVSLFVDASQTSDNNFQNALKDFTKETSIQVEQKPLPGTGDDANKKIDVSLLSGDKTDVFRYGNPIGLVQHIKSKTLMPLNDLAQKAGYNAEKVFGDNLMKQQDGKFYGLPYSQTIWAVYYNKKIFDDAKVPYPKGNWTWKDYVETAKKLNQPGKGIYGSYMLDYPIYSYILADQQKVSPYKADGTSNFDNPAFKASLQFFNDLGKTAAIQPSWQEFKTKKLTWDAFMTGKYGMHFISSWYLSLLTDTQKYPRDWKWGIAPTPTNENGKNNIVSAGYYVVNKNAANPEEAFQLVKFLSENLYKYSSEMPARIDLSKKDLSALFDDISKKSGDSVTSDELFNALYNNGLGTVPEAILGSVPEDYTNILNKEVDKYYFGQQSIDDTVSTIKKKVDDVISKAK